MADQFSDDIATIQGIAAVPTILDVVCRATGMGFAAVARVTEDRWIACGVRDDIGFGLLPGEELKVETTICQQVRLGREPVAFDHAAVHEVYRDHPTPALYGFQSYVSVPIVLPDGEVFGTLCAIDPAPHRVDTPATRGMFKLFAELLAFHIDAHRRLAASEASLLDERRTAELREQFIAVLGHDLRNPLASIESGAHILLRTPLNARATVVVTLLQNSVKRMSGLIDNVLDFARGRLGGGLSIRRAPVLLGPVLDQVVDELRAVAQERAIGTCFVLDRPVDCDPERIAQLVSNLLGNALTHGAAGSPVMVRAVVDETTLELSVANRGEPIDDITRERLFAPFSRGAVRPNQEGLGLGLYIASEIARAHGGRIDVASSPEETVFTLTMART